MKFSDPIKLRLRQEQVSTIEKILSATNTINELYISYNAEQSNCSDVGVVFADEFKDVLIEQAESNVVINDMLNIIPKESLNYTLEYTESKYILPGTKMDNKKPNIWDISSIKSTTVDACMYFKFQCRGYTYSGKPNRIYVPYLGVVLLSRVGDRPSANTIIAAKITKIYNEYVIMFGCVDTTLTQGKHPKFERSGIVDVSVYGDDNVYVDIKYKHDANVMLGYYDDSTYNNLHNNIVCLENILSSGNINIEREKVIQSKLNEMTKILNSIIDNKYLDIIYHIINDICPETVYLRFRNENNSKYNYFANLMRRYCGMNNIDVKLITE